MIREEGFYDLKRVGTLPIRGNANILYLLKNDPIESFYRWLPNKTYEELKIGGSGTFPGFTDLPTDYGITLGTVATTNNYNDLSNLPILGNYVTKVGTPVNNQIGIWTGDGTLEGDTQFTLENDSSFRRLNIGTSSTTGGFLRLYGHTSVAANSGISLQNNAGNQTNQEWWNIFPLFSGSQSGSLNFQATTGTVIGSALQLQSSTLLPLAVSATNTNIDAEATGKVLITREWIEAQGFGAGGTDDQTASEVPFTPYLTLGSTDTQAVVEELKDELDAAVIGVGTGVAPEARTAAGGETNWIVSNPITSSHKLFVNGVKLIEGTDYTKAGSTYTFTGYTSLAGHRQESFLDIAVPTTYAADDVNVSPAVGGNGDAQSVMEDHEARIDVLEAGSSSQIADITEYSTASSLPAVTGSETDTYAMVLFDTDANNGLYAIINGAWKLLVHEDDINWSSVIRPSINEINLRGDIVTSTTTATEDGIIVGYKFNIKDTNVDNLALTADATYYITDFIPIKPKGAVVIGATANTYWLYDKDKQPLDDADVDYNNRTYGYTTLSGDDEVAYIRWSLPISTIGNGSMAAQLYNVYENNPALQVTTGWQDYHGKAMGKIQISAGASGSIDGILVNGVEIMSGLVSYDTSRSVTATNVAININAHTSSPDYKATAIGEYILIWSTETDGSTANTYAVVSSATTLTTVDTNMAGGTSTGYQRDNQKYVFESNGMVWTKPTNNLYDYRFGEYPRNYQTTGVVSTSNASSGFIPCKGLRPYTLSTGANAQISFYTADKVFISGTTDWDGFVTPTTARYFTLQLSRASNFKSINITQSTYTQSTSYKDTGEELVSSNYSVNKSLCLIGDSIGTEGTTYASISSYASRLAIALGFNDFVNLSVSGKSLNQFAADINSGRQTAPVSDIYIIALGTNDHAFNRPLGSLGDTSATDTFFGDIQELVEAVQALNTNAEIAFITNGRRGTSATTTEWNATTSLWLQQFAGAIESYALQNNHEYVNLYEKSLANPQRSVINTNYYVSADATHLNNDGHNVFYFPLVVTMMKKLAK